MGKKSILIPTDGSPVNDEIIEFICSAQRSEPALITVITVIEVPRNLPLNADLPEQTAAARGIMQKARSIGEKYGLEISTSIIYARSAEEAILATADDIKCDVIAVGQDNHRLSVFANKAANIYQKAKCSVWLFNNKQAAPG